MDPRFMKDLLVFEAEKCSYFGLVSIGTEKLYMLHARQFKRGKHESQRHWISKDPTKFTEVTEGHRLLVIIVMACLGFVPFCIGCGVLYFVFCLIRYVVL